MGLLNDVQAIADVAHDTGRQLIVDSVSGLGGEALSFAALRPTAVCCTANKCFEGLPGVSFVYVRKGTELTARSVYLSLGTLLEKQRVGDTPFTPAIQVMAALDAALDVLADEGGIDGRIARYANASRQIRAHLADLGIDLLLPESLCSNTITCAQLPVGVDYEQLWSRMRESGYVIYAGQGKLKESAFRVANMGQIPQARLDAFRPALERAIS